MTTPPNNPGAPAPGPSTFNMRAVISVVETVAFVVAAVLQGLGYGNDAIVSALVGAVGHAVNHPAGGSPL